MKILFVNCIMRDESISRTYKLAKAFLDSCKKDSDTQICKINLKESGIKPLSAKDAERRDEIVSGNELSNEILKYALEFASADKIVIATPYWDLSFPSLLKIYVENIFVNRVTFCYTEEGRTKSLCKAKKLAYITTSGGIIGNNKFGEDYFRGICKMFEILDFKVITAEGLDIIGFSEEKIMEEAIRKSAEIAKDW